MKGSGFNTVLNIVLLIAVGVLFAMQFMNEKGESEAVPLADTTVVKLPEAVATIDASGKIVYVNTDSLNKHYKMQDDLLAKFEREQKQMEASIVSMVKAYETEVAALPRIEPKFMTPRQREDAIRLAEEKDRIYLKQQELSEQLTLKYEKYVLEINQSVLDYLESFRAENDYTFIFQYSATMGGLSAVDPSLDVTDIVLQGLNAEYEASKQETSAN